MEGDGRHGGCCELGTAGGEGLLEGVSGELLDWGGRAKTAKF